MRIGKGLLLAVLTGLLLLAPTGRAQDPEGDKGKALERKELDKRVFNSLRDLINYGADLWNIRQEYLGCYRLYEGGLMLLRPLLDHRPELQKLIDDKMKAAETAPINRKAFVLREAIDGIREKIDPEPKAVKPKTLWERLGGEKGVTKVVDDFVAAAAKDPAVNFTRDGKFPVKDMPGLKKKLVAMISDATGHTKDAYAKAGGKSMKEAHKGMAITAKEFDAIAAVLAKALKDNGVAQADIDAVLGAVAKTKADIVEEKKEEPKPKTLWERLGGEKGVTAVVKEFIKRAAADKELNFARGKNINAADLEKKLVAMISDATGHTKDAYAKAGGKSMKEAHKGMGITAKEFDASAALLGKVLKDAGVAQADIDAVLGAVAKTKADIVEEKKEEPKPKTLWERLGGEKGVTKVVDDFVAAAAKDPAVKFDRDGKFPVKDVAGLKKKLVAMISDATGHTKDAYAKAGGKSMKEAHKGMAITAKEFDAIAAVLAKALKDNGVAQTDIDAVLGAVAKTKDDIVEKKE